MPGGERLLLKYYTNRIPPFHICEFLLYMEGDNLVGLCFPGMMMPGRLLGSPPRITPGLACHVIRLRRCGTSYIGLAMRTSPSLEDGRLFAVQYQKIILGGLLGANAPVIFFNDN